MIKVKVPATSANIGPGFDTLGVAFNLYNTYSFEETDRALIIEGCEEIYQNKDNLVYKAFIETANHLGIKAKGLKINMDTHIPVSRGLGSSSSCIVGGVYGANYLLNGKLSQAEMFEIAAKIEGHPDNVAPAVFGGLTASFMDNGKPYSVRYKIDHRVLFCSLIPNFETSTREARKLLPGQIKYSDAIYNLSRVAVLLKALETGDFELIGYAIQDKLHQPYRKKLIHEYDEVQNICIENGSKAFFISGAGPTLMNIIENDDFVDKIKDKLNRLNYKWQAKILNVDENGAIIYS